MGRDTEKKIHELTVAALHTYDTGRTAIATRSAQA